MATNVFRIKNTETGLYSTGGYSPSFNKKGKSWNTRGHAISSLMGCDASIDTTKWVIVEYELNEVSRVSVPEIMEEKKQKKLDEWDKKVKALAKEISDLPEEAWLPENSLAGLGEKKQREMKFLMQQKPR